MARRNKVEMAAARELEARIVAVLSRTDNVGRQAVGRALSLLLDRQTTDEKRDQETRHSNMRGFTQGDAVKGQKHAEYFNAHGTLTDFQFNYWTRKRIRNLDGYITGFGGPANHIIKYRGQLMEEAQLKLGKSQIMVQHGATDLPMSRLSSAELSTAFQGVPAAG